MKEPALSDNAAQSRYEVDLGSGVAAFADYQTDGITLRLTHTEVLPGNEGTGLGSRLARLVLDDARKRGLHVVPVCSFMKTWIERHPDHADLAAPD